MNIDLSMSHQDPIFLRHDLMIEIDRVEMAIDNVIERHETADPELTSLQMRRMKLHAILMSIAA